MLPKIILTGRQIIGAGVVNADITLTPDSFIFIKGFVYSPSGKPLANASIEVLLFDHSVKPPFEISLGVTFTNSDGSYGMSIPRITDKCYKLIAYSPI